MSNITFSGTHITWFLPKPYLWIDPAGNQWYDHNAEKNGEGTNASGLPFTTPGFAFHNENHTCGGWWEIDLPGLHKKIIARQTDIGPQKSVIDLNAMLAYDLFYTQSRFIEQSEWKITYLGKELPTGVKEGITSTDVVDEPTHVKPAPIIVKPAPLPPPPVEPGIIEELIDKLKKIF